MPNKYYLREDRKAVKPTMEEPKKTGLHEVITPAELWNRVKNEHRWEQYLHSLPALDVDPDYLKRLSTGWFEGEERYEYWSEAYETWNQCDEYRYRMEAGLRRLTIVAPQEAEKEREGEDKFSGWPDKYPDLAEVTEEEKDDIIKGLTETVTKNVVATFKALGLKTHMVASVYEEHFGEWFRFSFVKCANEQEAKHLPATPQPVTGEAETKPPFPDKMTFQQMFDTLFSRDFMSEEEFETICKAAEMYANGCLKQAASRPSDAVEFAKSLLLDGHIQMVEQAANYTIEQLYHLFTNSKSPNPNK